MKMIMFAMMLLFGCGSSKAADKPAPTQAGSAAGSATQAPAPPRHLGEEYALKYVTEKFKLFEKPECSRWEDDGVGKTQSVVCTIGDAVMVYCRAGDGRAPTCEFVIDKRQKPPEESAKGKKAK